MSTGLNTNIIYLICFLLPLPGTDEETEVLYHSNIKLENQQGKTYIGQVQADCFCQVNILNWQTNPNYVSPSNEERHIVLVQVNFGPGELLPSLGGVVCRL